MPESGLIRNNSRKARRALATAQGDWMTCATAVPQDVLRPSHITESYHEVKERDFETDFRPQTRKWLTANLPMVLTAIDKMFTDVIGRGEFGGPIVANKASAGAYLGGSIVRRLIDGNVVSLEGCKANYNSWQIGLKGITYEGIDPDEEFLEQIFGTENTEALKQIQNPARAMCAMVLEMGLVPLHTSSEVVAS